VEGSCHSVSLPFHQLSHTARRQGEMQGREPTSDGTSDTVSGFRRLSPGVGVLLPSPFWPTLSACSHFCRASSNSSMPEHRQERREHQVPSLTQERVQHGAEAGDHKRLKTRQDCMAGPDHFRASFRPDVPSREQQPLHGESGRGWGRTWRSDLSPAWTPRRPFFPAAHP
jgi:hypothetical protein